MKKIILIIFASLSLLNAAAQTEDAFVVNFEFSIQSARDFYIDGARLYEERFRQYGVNASYEKFVWRNLFIAPQVSLWYSDNYNDILFKGHDFEPPYDLRPDLKYGDDKAWQFGGTLAVMGAWRVPIAKSFSLDVLTGPMLDISFKSKVKGLGLEYNNPYRTVAFDWRVGVGVNIVKHVRVGVNFDIRTGDHKYYKPNEDYVYFLPSGYKRLNAWNFAVGYRF